MHIMEASIKWTGDMVFSGTTPAGHEMIMDATAEIGGQNAGSCPMEVLLQALAGCTGISIISILKKMQLEPSSFEMKVKGIRAKEYPKPFTEITIHYAFAGDLPEDKVRRAIGLSKDKYCSVAHSLNAPVTVNYSINGIEGQI